MKTNVIVQNYKEESLICCNDQEPKATNYSIGFSKPVILSEEDKQKFDEIAKHNTRTLEEATGIKFTNSIHY